MTPGEDVSDKKAKHRISAQWQDYKQSTVPQTAQQNCNKEYDVKYKKWSWQILEDINCNEFLKLGNLRGYWRSQQNVLKEDIVRGHVVGSLGMSDKEEIRGKCNGREVVWNHILLKKTEKKNRLKSICGSLGID